MNQKEFSFTVEKEREATFTYKLTSDETGMVVSFNTYKSFSSDILSRIKQKAEAKRYSGDLSFYDSEGNHYSGWFRRLGEGFDEEGSYSKTMALSVKENVEVFIDVNFSLFLNHLEEEENYKRLIENVEISEELKKEIEAEYLNNESYGLVSLEIEGVQVEAQWQVSNENWIV